MTVEALIQELRQWDEGPSLSEMETGRVNSIDEPLGQLSCLSPRKRQMASEDSIEQSDQRI